MICGSGLITLVILVSPDAPLSTIRWTFDLAQILKPSCLCVYITSHRQWSETLFWLLWLKWWSLVRLQVKKRSLWHKHLGKTYIIRSFALLGLTFNNLGLWFDYSSYSGDAWSTFENKETWEKWMNKLLGKSETNPEPNQWVIVNNESLNLTLTVQL